MKITVECSSVEVASNSSRYSSTPVVTLNDVGRAELIDAIGVDDILDEIGEEACIKHFGIKVAE